MYKFYYIMIVSLDSCRDRFPRKCTRFKKLHELPMLNSRFYYVARNVVYEKAV